MHNCDRKKKKREKIQYAPGNLKTGVYLYIPLIFILGVIPLIVQMQLVPLSADVKVFWRDDYAADFFSYYKSKMLIIIAIYMICVFLYYKVLGLKDNMLWDKSRYVHLGSIIVFALFALLSTILSKYPSIAVWGAPERCEGIFMILIYLEIMLYASWAYAHKPEFKYILLPVGILILITSILGAFQFFGHDIFLTSFGKKLIIPAVYRSQGELQLLFERDKIYGTMYHYNFVGSFSAMMLPLFLVLAMFLKKRKQQIFCSVISIFTLFLLLGSTSRAGIIGTLLAALCFFIFFGKKLVEHYKLTIGCFLMLVVLVLGVNVATDGLALARIPSLFNDIKVLVSPSDVDYHNEIAVRSIDLQKDSITFAFEDNSIIIQKNINNQPIFTVSDGQDVTAPAEDCSLIVGNHKMELQYITVNNVYTPFLGIYLGENIEFILGLYDDGFSFVDNRMNKINYEEAPFIGLQGKELLGSARGYIWSRSLPIMMDSLFIGKGPDTFFTQFPQGDLLGKLYAYGTTQMIVDKPHSLYLQIGINEGGIALVAFLVMMIIYVADSFRLYALRKTYNTQQTIGTAIALAVIGYLGAGFFNDSVVSVAPIFWVLLGVGVTINSKQRKNKEEKHLEKI